MLKTILITTILFTGLLIPPISAQVENYDPCGLDDVICPGEAPRANYKVVEATVYAYTSREKETDSTPFITANGTKVREGGVANNCLPFGTKVEILFKTYEVNDRMNSRYGCNVFDVWHSDLVEARKWGKKLTQVLVEERLRQEVLF